jgi:ABC-type multidrug transport system ATPase subunit
LTRYAIVFILFQPITGLDSITALNIIKILKGIAKNHRKIVILTINHPRTDILDLIDKLLLMSMGKCVWFGENEGNSKTNNIDALNHFARLNYAIPSNTNPSDFYNDITNYDERTDALKKESEDRINLFAREFENKLMKLKLNEKKTFVFKNEADPPEITVKNKQWPSSIIYEIFVLSKRSFVESVRDPSITIVTYGQNLFLLVYFKINDQAFSRSLFFQTR